jgi:uncharacterized protein YjbI with pentapeptide repeats
MLAAVAAVAVTAFVVTVWLLAIASHARHGTDLANARLDAVRTGLAAGAGAGAAVGLMLAFRRQHHQEISTALTDHDATERRITDLYTRAVEQLGSDKAPVRLGGLYALERLAQDNPQQRQTIVNVVCAYLRMPFPAVALGGPAPPDDPGNTGSRSEASTATDVTGDAWQQEKQVRLTAQRILTDNLRQPKLDPRSAPRAPTSRLWGAMRVDLTGATLIDFSLGNCVIAEARFDDATFTGNARFEHGTFTGDAWFDGATFTGDAWFSRATFAGDTWFNRATFHDHARFDGVTFTGGSWFDGVTFTGGSWFDGAAFHTDARFGGAAFHGDARFDRATFHLRARFGGAAFYGDANFGGATLTGIARFDKATFHGNAEFSEAIFGNAGFHEATFQLDAQFDKTTFHGDVRFDKATFHGEARFGEAVFHGSANFGRATFQGRARFGGATFTDSPTFDGALIRSSLDRVRLVSCQVSRDADGQLTISSGVAGNPA